MNGKWKAFYSGFLLISLSSASFPLFRSETLAKYPVILVIFSMFSEPSQAASVL